MHAERNSVSLLIPATGLPGKTIKCTSSILFIVADDRCHVLIQFHEHLACFWRKFVREVRTSQTLFINLICHARLFWISEHRYPNYVQLRFLKQFKIPVAFILYSRGCCTLVYRLFFEVIIKQVTRYLSLNRRALCRREVFDVYSINRTRTLHYILASKNDCGRQDNCRIFQIPGILNVFPARHLGGQYPFSPESGNNVE